MNQELQMKNEETLEDYAMRLYFIEKAKHGLSKNDIATLLNEATGLSKDESAWRKHYASFKKGYDYATDSMDMTDEIETLRLEREELEKQTFKLRTERTLLNKKKRLYARSEMIFEDMLKELERIGTERKPIIVERDYGVDGIVIAMADFHVGALDENNSNEKLMERIDKSLADLVPMVIGQNVELLLLGDTIDGILRMSQLRKIENGISSQVVDAIDMIHYFINGLSQYSNVRVHMVTSSNHGQTRPLGSGRNDFLEDDMEYVIVSMLMRLFAKNKAVSFEFYENDHIDFELSGGQNILALHGHEYKKGLNGQFAKEISFERDTRYETIYHAHLHRFSIMTYAEHSTERACELIGVPAMTATNEHAKSYLLSSPSGFIVDVYYKDGGRSSYRKYV